MSNEEDRVFKTDVIIGPESIVRELIKVSLKDTNMLIVAWPEETNIDKAMLDSVKEIVKEYDRHREEQSRKYYNLHC